jgi:DNA-binding GntR family transcriptional regulator
VDDPTSCPRHCPLGPGSPGSRGPVRDAFRQLREEGLLRDVPRRGTYVVSLTADDVRDLLDLRAGLEARAARLVIERGPGETLADLEAAALALAREARTEDASAISAADFQFHETLCRLSASVRLQTVFVRYATELRILLRSDQERLYETGIASPASTRIVAHEIHGLLCPSGSSVGVLDHGVRAA